MRVFVNIKAAGRRKSIFTNKEYDIPETITSASELLTWFTRHETEAFNSSAAGDPARPLDCKQLSAGAEAGKISFGRRNTGDAADPGRAAATALSAFEDGLVRIFINDTEICPPGSSINLREGDVLTFIKLSFLAGRMW